MKNMALPLTINRFCTFAGLLLLAANAPAADIYKANNNSALNVTGSWVGNIVPTASDIAVWDSRLTVPGNCTNNPGNALSFLGIRIANPVVPVAFTNGGTLRTITLGTGGIDMNSPTSVVDFTFAPQLTVAAPQTWDVGAGRTLTLAFNSGNPAVVTVNADLTLTGQIKFSRQVNINNNATLAIGNGTAVEFFAEADSVIRVGNNASGGKVEQTGGTVVLRRSSADVLLIGQTALNPGVVATYNLSGGLLDASGQTIKVGNTANSPGALNITGNARLWAAILRAASQNSGTDSTIFVADNGEVYVNELYVGLRSIGTLTITNSAVVVSTNTFQLAGVSGSVVGSGYANLDGGTLTIPGIIRGGGAGNAVFRFNGGDLVLGANNASFAQAGVTLNVMAGGAKINSGAFSVTNSQPLLNGTGGADGGLIKTGSGMLVLAGANTYNGPTVVQGGRLGISTLHAGGGSFALADGTALGVGLASAGSSVAMSALTLGAATGAACYFDMGTFGNATAPVIFATNLSASGVVAIHLAGIGFGLGQFPLIKYEGTIGGTGFGAFTIGSLPNGVAASLVDNAANQSVDLLITEAPFLIWSGETNSMLVAEWDIGVTTNWINPVVNEPAAYTDGMTVKFDDSAIGTTDVVIPANVAPGGVNISNTALNYSFSGPGVIGGGGRLVKEGTGLVTMNVVNTYSGNTRIAGGVFKLGVDNAIPDGAGKGDVVVDGVLDVAGFAEGINGLSGGGIVTNSGGAPGGTVTLVIGYNTSSGVFTGSFWDDPVNAAALGVTQTNKGTHVLASANYHHGLMGFNGRIEIGDNQALGLGAADMNLATLATHDGAYHVTNNFTLRGGTGRNTLDAGAGDLTLWGKWAGVANANNRELTKTGPYTLWFGNSAELWLASAEGFDLWEGAVVVDGARLTNSNDGLRLSASNNALVRLVITNNGNYLLQGGANLRLGNTAATTFSTNILEIASGEMELAGSTNEIYLGDLANTVGMVNQTGGSLRWSDVNNPNGVRFASTASARGVYNLAGGTLTVSRVYQVTANGTGIFNFNGGTLRPANNLNAATFMQGLTAANVQNGGAIIDTAGIDLTIAQPLLAGGAGGLIKNGGGVLTLTGTNTYTGPTVVNQGRLVFHSGHLGGGAITLADNTGLTLRSDGVNSLRAANLTFGDAGFYQVTLNFDLGQSQMPTAPLIVTTNVTLNSELLINVSGNNLQVGRITLIQYHGAYGGFGFPSLSSSSLPPGVDGYLEEDPINSRIDLVITAVPSLTWMGWISGDWDSAMFNWGYGAGLDPALYQDALPLLFNDKATGATINLTLDAAPLSLSFSNTAKDYVITGAGKITGTAFLSKEGSGKLTLGTVNDYTGYTSLKGGVLSVALLANGGEASGLGAASILPANLVFDGGALQYTGGTVAINRGATLNAGGGVIEVFDPAATLTISGGIIGTGGLTKSGAGALTLSGANSFGGTLTVAGGLLKAGHASALGGTNGPTVVLPGGTLDLAGLSFTNKALVVSGKGLNDQGALISSVANQNLWPKVTLTGDTSIGGINNIQWGFLADDHAAGSFAGNGFKLTKVGDGDFLLKNVGETGLGDIDILFDAVSFQQFITLGDPAKTVMIDTNGVLALWNLSNSLHKVVVMNEGTIRFNSGPAIFTGPITLNSLNSNTFNGSAQLRVEGLISGPGVLSKTGGGILILPGANDYAGGSKLFGGFVYLGHDLALGSGLITISGGAVCSDGTAPRVITNSLFLTGGSTYGDVINTGHLTLTGPIDFNNAARSMTVLSDALFTGGSTNGRINKLGAGTMTLRGVHIWNGEAETRNGILIVEGIVTNNNAFRPDCDQAGGSARLVIANGGLAVYDGTGGNFRVGNDGNTTATNYLDIAGAIRMPTANVSNGRIFIGGGGTKGVATLLPGGDAEIRTVAKDGTTGYAQFNFNGGVLRAMGSTNNFIQGLDLALVQDGGAIIDTAGYDLVIAQPLLAGGTGGLTKNGLGTLTLTGANTYTGPTVVNGGTLILSSGYIAGHNYAVNPGAVLRVNAVAGTPLNASAVTAAGGGVLDLNVGVNATPATPVISAGALTINGPVTVNVLGQNTGANFTAGQRITLLTYTSASGLAGLQLGSLPAGLAGTLDHNVANRSVDLVITGSARALKWGGELGDAWDINTTVNWTNLVTGLWDVYLDDGNFGDRVLFDDTATTRGVNVTTDVRPLEMVVNNTLAYDIGGDGKIAGGVTLVKNGAGALTLSSANSYTGGTLVNGGTLRLGAEGAVGSGALQMAAGTTLSSDGLDARMITNAVIVNGNVSLGDAVLNGALTFSGPVNLGGATRNLTNDSDVLISGNSTNGAFNKLGAGIMTVRGNHFWNADCEINDGTMIIDGALIIKTGPVRPDCLVPGGLARLIITNGAQLFYTNTVANLRIGNDGNTTALNIADIAGLVRMPNATDANGMLALSQGGTRCIANLLPGGDIAVRRIVDSGGFSEVNFNGGIVRAVSNRTDFMQGLDQVFVQDGGAIFDTAGWDISILQPLLGAGSGAGGMTKIGAGTLRLNGTNAFVGTTEVTEGVLGGTGVLAGALRVQTNGALNPGNGIGTFTVNNTVTLEGVTVMEINRTNTQNADLLTGVTTLTAGGTLVVTNVGDTLQLGDTFNLLDAAAFAGGFAAIILPDLPTTEWKWNTNNLMVNGTIAVAPTNAPPVAGADGFAALVNQSTRVAIAKLMTNDFDPDGGALTFLGNFATNNGSVAIDGDHIVYTPANGFTGLDTFTYVVADALSLTATGLVSVLVTTAPPPGQNQLGAPVFEAGTATVRFAGIPGRDYVLLRALAVEGPWTPLRTNTAPVHGLIEFTDLAAPGPGAFYQTREK